MLCISDLAGWSSDMSNMPDVQYMATTLHMSVNACLCCMCNNAIPAWAESNKNAMLLSEEPNCVFSL